ncbi:hypothetical protein BOTBODRAFT_177455 [Botryobasidium botryosum FD-172 SS1]|uniref:Uncharacterized protein n=1 Tax=Botryobasidium botryosum (strain FD-172 SS1) TaxID=930990 RepID=A0A067MHZ6_BOTB1|nr:hypothetical protein BOTBODRAFT_177455 [Botryobasidium botryosum FD-172 SS1]
MHLASIFKHSTRSTEWLPCVQFPYPRSQVSLTYFALKARTEEYRPASQGRHLIYGYPRPREWLNAYAFEHKIGLDDNGQLKWDAGTSAAAHIASRLDFRVAIKAVVLKGESYLCIAFASNDPRDGLPRRLPKEERERIVKSFQEVLGTTGQPTVCDYDAQ